MIAVAYTVIALVAFAVAVRRFWQSNLDEGKTNLEAGDVAAALAVGAGWPGALIVFGFVGIIEAVKPRRRIRLLERDRSDLRAQEASDYECQGHPGDPDPRCPACQRTPEPDLPDPGQPELEHPS